MMKLIGGPWTAISPIHSSPAEIEQHHAVLFLYWQGTPIGFMLCAAGMLWLLWCHLSPRGHGSRADETPADRPQRGQA
ncbi:hypothetical protein [Leeia sp.]|uniref:hypothetical protein n=1 Tax=Leeia sp. TaxID=2884678 RepID=UPI0035B3BCA5